MERTAGRRRGTAALRGLQFCRVPPQRGGWDSEAPRPSQASSLPGGVPPGRRGFGWDGTGGPVTSRGASSCRAPERTDPSGRAANRPTAPECWWRFRDAIWCTCCTRASRTGARGAPTAAGGGALQPPLAGADSDADERWVLELAGTLGFPRWSVGRRRFRAADLVESRKRRRGEPAARVPGIDGAGGGTAR